MKEQELIDYGISEAEKRDLKANYYISISLDPESVKNAEFATLKSLEKEIKKQEKIEQKIERAEKATKYLTPICAVLAIGALTFCASNVPELSQAITSGTGEEVKAGIQMLLSAGSAGLFCTAIPLTNGRKATIDLEKQQSAKKLSRLRYLKEMIENTPTSIFERAKENYARMQQSRRMLAEERSRMNESTLPYFLRT